MTEENEARDRVPNETTRKAIAEAETILANGSARFATVEELMADLNGPDEEETEHVGPGAR